MKATYLSTFIIVLIIALPAHAEANPEVQSLETIEVHGRNSQSVLGDSALRTLVISAQELEKNHAKTLDEALRYTPGVDIKPLGDNTKNGVGVSIQGLDPSQTLIMVDGNPVATNSGDMVDSVDISQILIGDIERIEIVQGGASAIYGANAMGGVINIISKTPNETFATYADLSIGDWGSKSTRQTTGKKSAILSTSGKAGDFSTQLTANLLSQQGFDTNSEKIGTDGWHGYKNNVSAKFQYDFNKTNKLIVSPSIYQAQTATNVESKAIDEITKESKLIQERSTLSATYLGLFNDLHYKIHLMNQAHEEEKDSNASRLNQESQTNHYSVKLNKPLNNHFIGLSLEHKYEYLNQYNITKKEYEIQGKSKQSTDLSLSDSWYFYQTGDWELAPAIRYNQDENYGSHVSPMISLMYSNDRWFDGTFNIRTAISEGYKTPTLKQLYWEFDHNTLMYFGNQDLKPETSINTQIGFEFLTSNNSRYELHIFNNEISDLIELKLNPELANELDGIESVYEYSNIQKASTKGLNITYQKTFENIAINSGYSYINAINLETGKKLPKKPKNQFKLGIDFFNTQNIKLSLNYRFYSKQYADFENDISINHYDVVDLKFNQKISQMLSWYIGIDNMLDNMPDQYTSTGGHATSGNDVLQRSPRYMYLGVRLKH